MRGDSRPDLFAAEAPLVAESLRPLVYLLQDCRSLSVLHVDSSRAGLGGPGAQVFSQRLVSSLNVDDQPTVQSLDQTLLVHRSNAVAQFR